jgi:hypothetical protein
MILQKKKKKNYKFMKWKNQEKLLLKLLNKILQINKLKILKIS